LALLAGLFHHSLGLGIDREKTRVTDLKQNGASLDFLGFTFRYERDHFGHMCGDRFTDEATN
jgi:RNA-directed DNA polymerase